MQFDLKKMFENSSAVGKYQCLYCGAQRFSSLFPSFSKCPRNNGGGHVWQQVG